MTYFKYKGDTFKVAPVTGVYACYIDADGDAICDYCGAGYIGSVTAGSIVKPNTTGFVEHFMKKGENFETDV